MDQPAYNTADLYDRYEDELAICDPGLWDYGGHSEFHGRIRTLKCFEDNSLVRELLARPSDGDVLVIDAGGSLRCAMLGDMLANLACDNGWAGVVINGCIRDAAQIARMPLGVKALASHPAKSRKRGIGEEGVSVSFKGVRFTPGHHLYADSDGIVVSAVALNPPGQVWMELES